MIVTPLPIFTALRLVQPSNVYRSIFVTLPGISIEVSASQRANAKPPIVVTLLEIVTEARLIHPKNI